MSFSVCRTLQLIAAATLLTSSLSAQDGPGSILGSVQATENGSALSGTSVEVMGTSLRTSLMTAGVTLSGGSLSAPYRCASYASGTRL